MISSNKTSFTYLGVLHVIRVDGVRADAVDGAVIVPGTVGRVGENGLSVTVTVGAYVTWLMKWKTLKMLGLNLYTLIIGHKSCNMLSILNKLTL